MRKLLLCLSGLALLGGAALYAGQAKRVAGEVSPASVQGRVTVFETINRTPTTNPVRDLRVYIFTLEASKPFEELQLKCRRATAQPKADPVRTYQLCETALAEAYALVPSLPATATARTDRAGSFHLDDLAPDRQYHLVGIKRDEGGSPIVVVAKTPRLRSGQKLTLELSENEPWTGPLIMR